MEKDREILSAATKAALAFRILKVTQKDLRKILDPEGWEICLRKHKDGAGEHPQSVRRARVKASGAAQEEFWKAMKILDEVVG